MKVYLYIFSTLFLTFFSHSFSFETLPFDTIDAAASMIENEGPASVWNSPLAEYHDREVLLKGFLFKTKDGQWILSKQPDLKSCCAGSPKKVGKQIYLDYSFPQESLNSLVDLQGTFTIDIKKDLQGNTVQVYHLRDVKVLSTPKRLSPLSILAICSFTVLAISFAIRKKRLVNER